MPAMMAAAPYEIRTGGDGKSKKQSMAELKLRRLTELNQRLREDLDRRRIPVSEAALEYVPTIHLPWWHSKQRRLLTRLQSHCIHRQGAQGLDGPITMGNSASTVPLPHCVLLIQRQIDKREDPYAPQQSNGCCIVM
jgi:guanine nucleotide-binding protein subunit gamma